MSNDTDKLTLLFADVIERVVSQVIDRKFAGLEERLQSFMSEPTQKPDIEDLAGYTSKQVEELLHINSSTLWRWQKMGKLKPVKIGQKRIYRCSDVQQLLNN